MISKKATNLLAEIYILEFTQTHGAKQVKLYDFLYERNYDEPTLNSFKQSTPNSIKSNIQELQNTKIYGESGQELLKKLSVDILQFLDSKRGKLDTLLFPHLSLPKEKLVSSFLYYLELDGYIFKNGKLLPIENSVINQQTEQTYLEVLIDSISLSNSKVIKHHLNLSEEHYSTGKWGDCISNSRMALEAILQQVADAIYVKKKGTNLPSNIFSTPRLVRDYFKNENILEDKEVEVIRTCYGLLSNTGSHPNMSEKDQARLMRNLALSLSQYALITYEGFLKNNP
jgi:hypothetical protein